MAIPVKHYSDGAGAYAKRTGAILRIQSVIHMDDSLAEVNLSAGPSYVEFIGFLTNMSQNFNSTWNSENVYGRNDPIATFQGTKRTIAVSWDVPAGSLAEAKENLEKTAFETKFLYPAYEENIIARPPLVKVKYANLIQNSNSPEDGLLGWLDNLQINPLIDTGTFIDNDKNHYPKVISLSFNLNVLHQHDLGVNNEGKDRGGFGGFPF
jgi:hypothetical protein